MRTEADTTTAGAEASDQGTLWSLPVQPDFERGHERVTRREQSLVARRATRPTGAAPSLVAALGLVIAASVLAFVAWPGRMSNDTLTQIANVSEGHYSDWHAGLLIVLWRPFWLLGVGPGWVTWVGIVAFLCGLYGVLRAGLPRVLAFAATLAIAALPQVLGYVVYLGRDLWYTAFFLCCSAAALRIGRSRARAARALWVAAVVVFAWLMMAARQNAVPVAAVIVLGVVATHRPWPGLHRADGGWLYRWACRIGLAATVLALLVGSQVVLKRVFSVQAQHPEQATYIYDLAALSVRERQVLLRPGVFPAQDLAVLDATYMPFNVNTLLFGPEAPVRFPVPEAEFDGLRADWFRAVRAHPVGYLRARMSMYLAHASLTHRTEWVYHPVVDPNPWGYEVAHPRANHALQRYLRHFALNDQLEGGVVHTVWPYLAVTIFGLGYLSARRRSRRLFGWLCAASLVYQATIFVGAMGIGYRFAYPSVVLALVVATVACRDGAVLAARRLARRQADPAVRSLVGASVG